MTNCLPVISTASGAEGFWILIRVLILEHQLNCILRHVYGFFHRIALCYASGDIRDINRISNIFGIKNRGVKESAGHIAHLIAFCAIQKREQPNVPAFAASIPSATYHILDVVGLP